MVYTINSSLKLDTKHHLMVDFLDTKSVNFNLKIHDPNFYLPADLSTSIPGLYHQLKQGETYMGKYHFMSAKAASGMPMLVYLSVLLLII